MKLFPRFFTVMILLAISGFFHCETLFAQEHMLYGLTSAGGSDNLGTIIHYDPVTGEQVTDYSFRFTTPGANPSYNTDLTDGGDGKFYAVTSGGGLNNAGVIFEWDPLTNTYIKKIDFSNEGGCDPIGSLTLSSGKFYGMTNAGGSNNAGVIFEWDPLTNTYTKRIDLSNAGGCAPRGSLTLNGGKFYGMTYLGGLNNQGVIFEWDPSTNTYAKKIDMSPAIGANPSGNLTLSGGKFYGMTQYGGSNNAGVIFEWDPATNTYNKKTDMNGVNGSEPVGSLTLNGGKFYGVTSSGGSIGAGSIFEWDPATNIFTNKFEFDPDNGIEPIGSLNLSGGKFYGMTQYGGSIWNGSIFEWDPATNIFTKKIDLDGANGGYPYGSLSFSGGKFYGMTSNGGLTGEGVIFEWTAATNAYVKKIDLNMNNGSQPMASLTYSGGKFYGMTNLGGLNNGGVIFEWDPATSTYTKKIDLSSTTGESPEGSLTFNGGKFYGMTKRGGSNDAGVIFEWDPATNAYTKKIDLADNIGSMPMGSLILSGGMLYGMTTDGGGGSNGYGVIFEWNPVTNVYTKKVDLGPAIGTNPVGALSLCGGKFYGMTSAGGSDNAGVIFEWDPVSNTYTKKIDLSWTDGCQPYGSLTLNGGKFYGTTFYGGSNGVGVIFEWNPYTNIYTKQIDMSQAIGQNPECSLTLTGGKFYGMTRGGGSNNAGVIFEWDPATNTYFKKTDLGPATGRYPYYSQFVENSPCINPIAGGIITADQSGCTPFDPAPITSSSDASGYSGTLEYKWQKSIAGSTTGFTDIEYSNSATYNPPADMTQTTWYKRVANVNCMSDWSDAAESNVVQISVDLTTVGGAVTGGGAVCNGFNNTLLTLSGHTGLVIRWEFSTNGTEWNPIANTTLQYTAVNLTQNTWFRAVVQNGECLVEYSSPTQITIFTDYRISGYAKYNNNPKTPLNGLKITLKQGGTPIGTPVITGTTGYYEFAGLINGTYDLEIAPAHATGLWQTWGGVNNTDYLLVARHAGAVSLLTLNPPVVRVAADVKSPSTPPVITTDDATAVKYAAKYGWGSPVPYFDIPKWVFSGLDAATTLTGIELACGNVARDIRGLCAGDVNASYVPPYSIKQATPGVELVNRGLLPVTQEITFPVKAETDMEIGAITLMLDFNASLMEITGVEMPGQADPPYFTVTKDVGRGTWEVLNIGWMSLDPLTVVSGQSVLLIHARMTNIGITNMGMTNDELRIRFTLNDNPISELADAEGNVIDGAKLAIADAGHASPVTRHEEMLSVYPNPVSEVISIEYLMETEGMFSAELLNPQGVVVMRTDKTSSPAGLNKTTMNLRELPNGAYLMKAVCGENMKTVKVIVNR